MRTKPSLLIAKGVHKTAIQPATPIIYVFVFRKTVLVYFLQHCTDNQFFPHFLPVKDRFCHRVEAPPNTVFPQACFT